MKIVGILLGLVLLAVPLSVDGLTVSEIERKLSQAQSQEDVESVILEIVTSSEYQKACQQLFDKINSLPPPQKTQAYLDKALPILQDYENLKCQTLLMRLIKPNISFQKDGAVISCESMLVEIERAITSSKVEIGPPRVDVNVRYSNGVEMVDYYIVKDENTGELNLISKEEAEKRFGTSENT